MNLRGDRKVVALICISTLLILSVGLITDLRYSDEIFHFWWAKQWYESGQRPVFNELVDTVEEFDYFRYYVNAPLWHFGLQGTMNLLGPHKAVAQVYQALFYALLLVGTYLLTKELYGSECAWYATVIVATVPMFVSLSVLFFIDVPIASLTPFLLLAMRRKRFIVAGFVLAAMLLMKRNSYLLIPSVVALALIPWDYKLPERIMSRGLKALSVLLLVLIVNAPDLSFRYEKFGGIVYPQNPQSITRFLGILPPKPLKKAGIDKKPAEIVSNIHYTEEATIPSNIFKFLGAVLPILLLVAIVVNRYERKDLWLLLPCFTYLPFFLFFFKGDLAVRYFSPIIPFFCIFSAKGLVENSARKYSKTLVLLVCFVQMLTVLGYVYSERRIAPDEKEGLSYIDSRLPEEARILTPEELLVSYHTNRPTLWSNSFSYDDNMEEEFYNLLWGGESKAKAILDKYKIKYVIVQQHRIYDDSSVKHYGGFPSSFVEKRLPLLAQKIWENEAIAVWQVM